MLGWVRGDFPLTPITFVCEHQSKGGGIIIATSLQSTIFDLNRKEPLGHALGDFIVGLQNAAFILAPITKRLSDAWLTRV